MLDVIGAFVGDFIDKVTGMAEAKRRRKKTCEIMIGVFSITKCQTVSEIDFRPDTTRAFRSRRPLWALSPMSSTAKSAGF